MAQEYFAQQVKDLKQIVHTIPNITPSHAFELETSLDMIWHALTDAPDQLQEWTHITLVVDKDMFANAGYDVSTLTKNQLDELADSIKDFWIGGKGLDQAIEYATEGILDRVQDDECECCTLEHSFVLDQDGACARCRHEQEDHYEGRETYETEIGQTSSAPSPESV